MVNELVTNSLKYAFKGRDSGCLTVSIRAAGERRYSLTVRDDGIGLEPGLNVSSAGSLGLRLVRILVTQLHGQLSCSNGDGSEFRVDFPEGPNS